MKLIRFVTDNNGIFKSNFGNEMFLKDNSKMALLNLTFETAFNVIQIDSTNNSVTFQSDITDPNTVSTANLSSRSYNRNQVEDFYNDLKYTLNSLLQPNISGQNWNGSEFDIRFVNGLKQIEYRYSPFLNPLFLPDQGFLMDFNNNLIEVVTTSQDEGNYYDLAAGTPWILRLTPGGASQGSILFSTSDLGNVAKFRSAASDGSGQQWWIPTGAFGTGWNIYNTKPTAITDPADLTAILDAGIGNTFVLTLSSGSNLTPYVVTLPLPFVTPGPNTTISLQGGVPAVADTRKNNLFSTAKLCLGSGLMTARVADFVENSSGLQDNGFALCLSKSNLNDVLQPGDDIDVAFRDFEIRFNREGEDYVFINKASGINTEQNTGIQPNKTQLSLFPIEEHDVIYYEVLAGVLSGGVLQDKLSSGGVVERHEFFAYTLDPNETYFPYIYIRGRKPNIKMDMFNFTMNPWINNEDDGDDIPPYWDLTGLNFPGNPHSAFTNGIGFVVDNGDIFDGLGTNAFLLPDESRWVNDFTSKLTLDSQIWNFLGYNLQFQSNPPNEQQSKNIKMGPNDGRNCWNFWPALQEPRITLSDNFIVESMTVPLDSYDSSEVFYSNVRLADGSSPIINPKAAKKGRRKNILMTLPVNDNTSGLVEYESQNLIFIDIKNAEKLNLRNMDFRILDKSFNEIKQSGESAVMTILIDG